jgi:integrase
VAKLNTLAIKRLKKPGHYGDGDGLYLKVASAEARSWQFRYKHRVTGKTVWLGLGAEKDVTLAEAREKARECRRLLTARIDPLAQRRADRASETGMTFAAVAELYLAAHEASWRNEMHRQQWRSTLRDFVAPAIGARTDGEGRLTGGRLVSEVMVGDIMKILEPLWQKKPATASRVRGRIESILDYASARGWRTGDNPARWRGHLANLLPADGDMRTEHHAALPWQEVGALMAKLRQWDTMSARAAEFTILTAARSGEVRGLRWTEIDLQHGVWTVPVDRMKAAREHRVPLSDRALAILKEMAALRRKPEDLVFPGGRNGRALSDVGLSRAVKVAGGVDLTMHGFRSTFRDWCAEATAYPREVAEGALAHVLADKTEAAYRRTDLLAKRARLMADWAEFCARPAPAEGDNVRAIRG